MCNVVIIGAGGHAKVIADIVLKSGDNLVGFLDDTKSGNVIGDYCVLGKVEDAEKFADDYELIIAIGSNSVRKAISEKLNAKWYTAIHPSAQIGCVAEIGEGSCVMANAAVNSCAVVGKHCIVNTGAVIEHDCRLENYVHVSPNATLCGTVSIGELTHIGAAAVVKNNISVCREVTVGVGAAVVKNITESGIYVGVPAKKK